jgi:hypothetical protein
MKSSFFVGKSRKRLGCDMSTSSAIFTVEPPCKPFRENSTTAAEMTSSRRWSAAT